MNALKSLIRVISDFFWLNVKEDMSTIKPPTDEEMLKQAHSELWQAQHLFTRVIDHEMVDYAIYLLNASEIRYDYLIKELKKKNISFNN